MQKMPKYNYSGIIKGGSPSKEIGFGQSRG